MWPSPVQKTENLVSDVIALADVFGFERFNLAGHDFGDIVSWNLVDKHPARIKRLVIYNVPHPQVLWEFQESKKEQRQKNEDMPRSTIDVPTLIV